MTKGTERRPIPAGFARLWAASTASGLGDGLYTAALPLLAITLTTDPIAISLITAAALLPWPVLGLLGGALVDRWERPRAMWWADLARAALLAVAVVGMVLDLLSVPVLMVLAFLLGCGQLVFDTAAQAYLPALLERDRELLLRGNARLRQSQMVTEGLVGPPIGATLYALDRLVPFVADACSFVVSALLIRSLPSIPVTRRPAAGGRALLADAKEGAAYLLGHRVLLGLSIRPAIGNLAFSACTAVLVLFAHQRLGLDATGFGLLLTAEAVGGLLGTFAARPLERFLGIGRALTATAGIEALAVLGIGLSTHPVQAGAGYALCGAAMAATMVMGPSIRQAIVPDHLMGRVGAASRLMAVSAGPIGAVLGGWLATVGGLSLPYLVAAGVLAVMTVVTASLTTNQRVEAALAAATTTQNSAPS